MSVAFRRESDEEHKEPKFELPLPSGPNIVTPRGLALIEAQVASFAALVASAHDDDERETPNRDLRYWNTRLSTARVAPPATVDSVSIGSRVAFRLNGETRSIDIVGHDEADPDAGRLSYAAPLARAMIGAAPGDTVDFAGVADAIEILSLDVA